MKNCLIFGAGRSGTSMLAGMLHQAGYYMGEGLYKGNNSNPKGFFECKAINSINERILLPYNKRPESKILRLFCRNYVKSFPTDNQRWLSSIPPQIDIKNESTEIEESITKEISKVPFCYKDPRFSYTLPIWEKHLKRDTVFLCIFRRPNVAVKSILKECADREYLKDLYISRKHANEIWCNIYLHIFKNYKKLKDRFLFVNYDNVIAGAGIARISDLLQADIRTNFVDAALRRTLPGSISCPKAEQIYNRLCVLSNLGGRNPDV